MKKIRFGIVGLGNQGSYYETKLFKCGRIENGEISVERYESYLGMLDEQTKYR